MSEHLSEDQISGWMVGRSTIEELEHVQTCPNCRAELERFGNTLSRFRIAVTNYAERHAVLPALLRPARSRTSVWRWVFAAATVIVMAALIPIYNYESDRRDRLEAEEAELLMDAVTIHLNRVVPAPMEPVMLLLPTSVQTPPAELVVSDRAETASEN
jgi:hypothetical protein